VIPRAVRAAFLVALLGFLVLYELHLGSSAYQITVLVIGLALICLSRVGDWEEEAVICLTGLGT